ncbi:uncharacterized protein HKW66_Vig0144950 [Vigna angularis]|uniref:Uncharacterized protein n=1 Tax=Phaseolus angularis TaxID=3914 RepID=A0A8T0KDC8_PHAAN|nr:uncharacterized protein HKW66_Vig0144950 [Vigna angularis]
MQRQTGAKVSNLSKEVVELWIWAHAMEKGTTSTAMVTPGQGCDDVARREGEAAIVGWDGRSSK